MNHDEVAPAQDVVSFGVLCKKKAYTQQSQVRRLEAVTFQVLCVQIHHYPSRSITDSMFLKVILGFAEVSVL